MDVGVVLVAVLVVVLVWRGPKTLPSLGRALGRGVHEARHEIEGAIPRGSSPGDESRLD